MISKVWMINAVLAIVLVICLMNVWDVWHTPTDVISEKKPVIADKEAIQKKNFSKINIGNESAYESVVDKNLFSPDRAPAPPEKEVETTEIQEDVRISGEKVVLYGVVMIDDYKKALINNPGERKTGSNTQWISEGETIGGLKVQKIQEEEILLVDGANSFRVLLYDPEKTAKSRGQTSVPRKDDTQPQVISAGEKPRAEEKKVVREEKISEKVTISADGKYEIIDTPLGKIKRKRK